MISFSNNVPIKIVFQEEMGISEVKYKLKQAL